MKTDSLRFIFIQIISLVALVLFLSLGTWQLGRGNIKSDIEHATSSDDADYQDIRLPLGELQSWRYKKITLQGVYDSTKQFLLDNQVRDGISGYNVLSPLSIEQNGNPYWVLVDRGWLPQAAHREILPSVEIEQSASQYVKGSVYVPYAETYSLGGIADGEDSGWPRRIQFVDYQQLSDRLNITLQPFTLRLDENQPHGYRRDWSEYSMSAQKHFGYAFQWFAMALAVVVLWWWYCIKPLLKKT